MSEREIPLAAIEAAAKAFIEHGTLMPVLRAAAPYLMAQAWDDGLEWGAAGEYIPASEYTANPYRKGVGDE